MSLTLCVLTDRVFELIDPTQVVYDGQPGVEATAHSPQVA